MIIECAQTSSHTWHFNTNHHKKKVTYKHRPKVCAALMYLMERPQDLLPGIRLEVPINDVRDHEAGSARFVGHRGGWGWRDATENLLQAPVIHHLTSGICTGGGWGVEKERESERKKRGQLLFRTIQNPFSLACGSASWGGEGSTN